MALQDYVYSITEDFVINQKVDITILQIEIEESTIITTELHHIDANLDEDLCEVWFNDALTQPEETELDAIVAAHTGYLPGGVDPGNIPDPGEGGFGDLTLSFGAYDKNYFKFAGSSWEPCPHFIFRGTNQLGKPIGCQAVIYSKGDINHFFDLRLYDVTNSRVIFEWLNISREKEVWSMIGQNLPDAVWPTGQALIELQGRKALSDGCDVYLSFFMIQFSGEIIDNI
jgi:hypothetical protein